MWKKSSHFLRMRERFKPQNVLQSRLYQVVYYFNAEKSLLNKAAFSKKINSLIFIDSVLR